MKFTLREYQRQAIRAVIRGFLKRTPEGMGPFQKLLLVAATGAGKTIMASALAWWIADQNGRPNGKGRVLMLADTDELVSQAADKILKATGLIPDIEKARSFASLESQVVVGSIQTLASRFDRFPADHFDLIIADEAHLSMADNWQRVLGHFAGGGGWILGITATPERGDGQSLMDFYEHVAYEIGLFELIDLGMLAPLTVQVCPVEIDLRALKTKKRGLNAGNFEEAELEEAIEPYWHAVIDAWEQHAEGRKTLWFLPSIRSSKKFAGMLQSRGHVAAHVDGTSKDRREILRAYEENRTRHLCNSKLLQKGYDCDDITCVVNLAPGKSRTDFFQKIGRGTRLAREKGKTDCLILDFLWQFAEMGIMRPAGLIATSDEAEEGINRVLAKGQRMALGEASMEAEKEREAMIIAKLKRAAKKAQAGRYDARDLGAMLHQPELIDYVPRSKWEKMGITHGQKRILDNAGIDPKSVHSLGHAFKILDALSRRRNTGMANPKQVAELIVHDVPNAHQLSFSDAFDRLQALIDAAPSEGMPDKAYDGPAVARGVRLDD